jgi:hypothetical protein
MRRLAFAFRLKVTAMGRPSTASSAGSMVFRGLTSLSFSKNRLKVPYPCFFMKSTMRGTASPRKREPLKTP